MAKGLNDNFPRSDLRNSKRSVLVKFIEFLNANLAKLFKDPFLLIALAFLLGVLLSSIVDLSFSFASFIVLLFLVLLIYSKIFVEKDSKRTLILISISILVFSLGILRFEIKDNHVPSERLLSKIGQTITLEGVVTEEPKYKNSYREYILKSDDEKLLVRADVYPEFKYGDKLKFSAKL